LALTLTLRLNFVTVALAFKSLALLCFVVSGHGLGFVRHFDEAMHTKFKSAQ